MMPVCAAITSPFFPYFKNNSQNRFRSDRFPHDGKQFHVGQYKPERRIMHPINKECQEIGNLGSDEKSQKYVCSHELCHRSSKSHHQRITGRSDRVEPGRSEEGKSKTHITSLNPYGRKEPHFRNLTHLDISGNSAEKLDLRSLNRLEWLCCSNNNLEVLYLAGNSLTYLDCSYNNLQSISVDPVPNNLTSLQISYNNMEDLPSWTWMVPELFLVRASHNKIRQLDCKFQNCLPSLPVRELYLHSNQIEFVSKDFVQRASRLKALNMAQNLIEFMPSFGKKSTIQELYISRNQLQDCDGKDAVEFVADCHQLKRLHLGYNRIERISEKCMSSWRNLEELILCGNRLRALPSKMCNLTSLKVLRVHSNKLETPPLLSKMPSLKVVDLSHNNLRKINLDTIISGGNLSYLDISCNEKLALNPDKLNSPRRQMNLIEVSEGSKSTKKPAYNTKPVGINGHHEEHNELETPWEMGFSELPDRSQHLNVMQYRDVKLSNGREALFGIFDGGESNPAPKSITKSIAQIFAEEKNIEETYKFSLKYTLLSAIKSAKKQGNCSKLNGILCLLTTSQDNLLKPNPTYMLNIGMIGGVRCVIVEHGKKITRLTDYSDGSSLPTYRNESDAINDGGSNNSSTSNNENNIPDPYILAVPITCSTQYLILANKNVWTHLSEEEIVDELESNKNKKCVQVAKRITDMAQSFSCRSSLSLIIIQFRWSGGKLFKEKISCTKSEVSNYDSASSDCSDISNPLVSVTTPDSAIETDRSSNCGGSLTTSRKSSCKSSKSTNTANNRSKPSRRSKSLITPNSQREIQQIPSAVIQPINDLNAERPSRSASREDLECLGNTSVSQMSVEQFRCWEYMLEQNTRLLFKKELDSLSKGVFQRNNKQRKSVHFPYQDQTSTKGGNLKAKANNGEPSKPLGTSDHAAQLSPCTKSTVPGFYTLSKAKSLSHLFAATTAANANTPSSKKKPSGATKPSKRSEKVQKTPESVKANNAGGMSSSNILKSHVPLFGTNGNNGNNKKSSNSSGGQGFFGSIRMTARRALLQGGPNSAYFGSSQRLSSPVASTSPTFYDAGEIQEVKSFDSMEHDHCRLKKYWDDKITEL